MICCVLAPLRLTCHPGQKFAKYKFNFLAWTDIQQHVCWSHSIWDSFETYGAFSWMRRTELTVENKSKQPSLLMTQYTSGRRGPFPVGCTKAADKHGETRLQMLSQGHTERIFCPYNSSLSKMCVLLTRNWGGGGNEAAEVRNPVWYLLMDRLSASFHLKHSSKYNVFTLGPSWQARWRHDELDPSEPQEWRHTQVFIKLTNLTAVSLWNPRVFPRSEVKVFHVDTGFLSAAALSAPDDHIYLSLYTFRSWCAPRHRQSNTKKQMKTRTHSTSNPLVHIRYAIFSSCSRPLFQMDD